MTPISDFLDAWDKDPRITTKLVPLRFFVDERGAHFTHLRHSISFVWLQLRLRRPELKGEPWDKTLQYAAGAQVYFVIPSNGRGNFYVANALTAAGESPDTTPAKWDLVTIPYFLRQYLIHAGYADWLIQDGQQDKADNAEGRAVGYLEQEADKLQRQGGQVRRLDWTN